MEYAFIPFAVVGLVMANAFSTLYGNILHEEMLVLPHWFAPHNHFNFEELTLDFFFAFVFAGFGVELMEARYGRGGSLSTAKKAALPLAGTLGGVVVPVAIYAATTRLFIPYAFDGYLVPAATDIVFSLALATFIAPGNKAVRNFLLALAVIDDAIASLLIPVAYAGDVDWLMAGWLIPSVLAFTYFMNRVVGVRSGTFYALMMLVCWWAFLRTGIHPTIGMLPVLPMMPKPSIDDGIGAPHDLRNMARGPIFRIGHVLERLQPWFLIPFAFVAAGVTVESFSAIFNQVTGITLVSLFFGKLLGIWGFAEYAVRRGWASYGELDSRKLAVSAGCASIGFTVSLFVARVATDDAVLRAQLSLGAMLSAVVCSVLTILLAILLGEFRPQASAPIDPDTEGDNAPELVGASA